LDADAARWVEQTLESLSLREAVGQLIIPWMPGAYASTSGPEFEEYASYVEEAGIGGVSISIGLPHSYGAKLNALQERARIPLLVTSDFENGGPGMRINHSYAIPTLLAQGGGTSFPPTMAFGAIGEDSFAAEYGRITAVEARAVGVHLNFAPVLDVNSNPDNPVINTRSFGEDPEAVARLGAAYLEGARAGGVLTTAKHYPGHGDTRTDSHVELPLIDADRRSLELLELRPFRRAVAEGVDAVMTAHVAVPAILGSEGPPATLSPYFLTELLREDMGFQGLVLTDALRNARGGLYVDRATPRSQGRRR
jgi:beta-N-acetylhexosaminidase